MKVVIAPDSFKGCLTAHEVARAIATGFSRGWPDATLIEVPMADGGEGSLQSLVDATGGELIAEQVTGPLGEPIVAHWGICGETGVVEMAQAAGLPLVPLEHRDPMVTTSWGVGELIRRVLERGLSRCILCLGGSATVDGGIGLLMALGARFLDEAGDPVPRSGEGLVRLASVDLSSLDPRLATTTFIAAHDVANPLLEALLYAPQKGARQQELPLLKEGLARLARLMPDPSIANRPGSGAAGGMGGGVAAFLMAKLQPGVELIAQEVGLAEKMVGADLVITGEGEVNSQTLHGKTPMGVAQIAKQCNLPVIALAGNLGEGWQEVVGHGIDAAFAIAPGPLSLEESVAQAQELLATQAFQLARILRSVL